MPASLREASACRKGEGDRTGTNPTSGTAAVKAMGTGGSACFLTAAAGKADGKTNDHCSTVLPAPATAAFPGKQPQALLGFVGTRVNRAASHPTAVGASLEIGVRGEESTRLLPPPYFAVSKKNQSFISADSREDISNTRQPQVCTNVSSPPRAEGALMETQASRPAAQD